MITNIIKRDNKLMPFDKEKILNVIRKAFVNNGLENESIINSVFERVMDEIIKTNLSTMKVEEIQDIIQKILMKEGYLDIAQKFIEYRFVHKEQRDRQNQIYTSISSICKVTDRENANVGNGPSSKMLQIAETSSKAFNDAFLEDKKFLNAKLAGKVYDHDASWGPVGTTTCTFIPLRTLIEKGFNTGHGFIRVPQRIKTAAQLACISLQANQNDQHGGQAFGWFDRDLVNAVKREYEWQKMNIINSLSILGFIDFVSEEEKEIINSLEISNDMDYEEICDLIYAEEKIKETQYKSLKGKYRDILNDLPQELKIKVEKLAWNNTEKETLQAMEATIHNLNSMHSRAGAQVPFSSINIGTDTTKEGRLVAKSLMLAYEKGLGKGEQPIFPNIIFKVKDGVNYEPDSPNFDLFLIALRVGSKRLFPTFCFQDATINKNFPEDVPTMGCRTRVSWNRHGKNQTCEGRGNLSFTTVNLSGIALDCKINKKVISNLNVKFEEFCEEYGVVIPEEYSAIELIKTFFLELNDNVDIAIQQLYQRFKYQSTFKVEDFPFLMSGVWMDSEKLRKGDTVGEVIKHGTLGLGFIALAECLLTLVGVHHGQSEIADKLGLEIVKFLNTKTERASDLYNLNYAVIGTPAEGLTGKFLSKDKNLYGTIEGITDKEWYTNSCHIPVEFEISIFEKIRIEGQYTKYCAGGSITYVELNESPLGNIDAYYKIVQAMHDADVVYGAINFPCDRCKDCGHFGIIPHECPNCGSIDISRIRRITGYLSEEDNFNYAKKCEKDHRVKHMTIKKVGLAK